MSDNQTFLESLETPCLLDLIPRGISVDQDKQRLALEQQVKKSQYLDYQESSHQWFSFRGQDMLERNLWLRTSAESSDSIKRFTNLLLCRSGVVVEYSESLDTHRVRIPTCGNRFCPHCCRVLGKERSQKIKDALRYAEQGSLKFLTIAPSHVDVPLEDQLRDLKQSFRRLRQRKEWKQHFDYGTAVIEIKIGIKGEKRFFKSRSGKTTCVVNDGLWHPHLHIIAHGSYFAHDDLLDLCRGCFRRECSVDIRAVHSKEKALEYCCKYVAKPCRSKALFQRREKALELYESLYNKKTCWTWGDTPEPLESEKEEKKPEAKDWCQVYSFNQLCHAIVDGNKQAIALFESLGLPVDQYKKFYERGSPCQT